jgi:GT2 family glycosyltransferase
MEAWRKISNYPDWFLFYGEEAFASYQLFKNDWQVWFVPDILVQHRVDIKTRKKNSDYTIRLRRSLRSGWYLFFLFYPWDVIPKKIIYTLFIQIKKKVLKGDVRSIIAISGALIDLILKLPKLIFNRNALNKVQYRDYTNLPETVIYWQPTQHE